MDWITEVKPDIEARMASYDEGAGDFVLMSLVHDPLVSLIAALAENVRANQAATSRSERSNSLRPKSMTNGDCSNSGPTGLVLGPDPAYDLTQTAIDHASVPERTLTILDDDDCEKVVEHQSELIATQTAIRASIRGELDSRRADEEKADGRRFDFGPLALKMARILARKRVWGKKRKQRKRQRK
jgi:ubiquitin carboxyl-terminal hydrolase L5